MNEKLADIRKALDRDARDLELFNHRLRQLLGQLPAVDGRETDDLPEEPDAASELRGVLQCVLADHLEPAVRALRAAAEPARRGGGDPAVC